MVAAILAVTAGGVAAMRANQLDSVLRLVGIETQREPSKDVESYAHRAVLVWIGWHIFLDHPIAGAGLGGIRRPGDVHAATSRRLDARYPDEPPLAFPSPEHRYGVQNLYVQFLADLGIVGLILLLAVFAAARAAAPCGPVPRSASS